jgi:TolB-like protein
MSHDTGTLRFGDRELDFARRELREAGKPVVLQPTPLRVLLYLAAHRDRTVPRRELLDAIWPDVVVGDEALTTALSEARRAVGDDGDAQRVIRTLKGAGYRFVAEVVADDGVAPGETRRRKIAVLPLENLSGDPEQEYFADGMTEALIGDLGKLAALRVISRTSVMQYKGARKPLPKIARELDVDAIVEGTVMRAGDRVRIDAQLIDGRSDEHIWAERYERALRDVLELQSDVAQAIARAIQLELSPSERARLERRRPVDPAAHDALLKGTHHFHRRFTRKSMRSAIQFFERAIELDPAYALAHAWLGIAWWEPDTALGPPLEVMPKAKAAGHRALELDETLGETHALLGYLALQFDWDWPRSESHFQRALELNPSFPLTHSGYSLYLASRGRYEEAIVEERRAVELAPLELVWRVSLAARYEFAGRCDDALAQARDVLDLDSSFRPAQKYLVGLFFRLGRYTEWIDANERVGAFTSQESSALRDALSKDGARGVVREYVRFVRGPFAGWSQHLQLAHLHARLGENDEAFAELEHAYATRDPYLSTLRVFSVWDSIRDDPRFDELTRRIGIPES